MNDWFYYRIIFKKIVLHISTHRIFNLTMYLKIQHWINVLFWLGKFYHHKLFVLNSMDLLKTIELLVSSSIVVLECVFADSKMSKMSKGL